MHKRARNWPWIVTMTRHASLLRVCATLLVLVYLVTPAATAAETVGAVRGRIVRVAMDPLGVPYVWGGTNPQRGLDCSGFALTVYRQAGLELPRVSAEQFVYTQYLRPDQAQRGDLVFFNMKLSSRKKVDHVGIYLGSGYFAHASFSRGIIIDQLTSPYYRQRLQGIRRHPALVGAQQ
jgi:cell wall-associated NlpC family hydrolase